MSVMKTRQARWVAMLAVTVSALVIPAQAPALGCRDWTGLYGDERYDVLLDDLDRKVNSGRARNWNINRNRLMRCLQRSLRWISEDLDDTCDQGMRVSMRAADDLVWDYIRSCVQ